MLEIRKVLRQSPAEKAGLRKGDRVLAIDGKPAAGRSSAAIMSILQGEPGTGVTVSIRTPSGEKKELRLTRKVLQESTVLEKLIEKQVGYMRIESLGYGTPGNIRSAVNELLKEGAESFVLDLRNNEGGIFTSVTGVAQLLLPAGRTLVTIKGGSENESKAYTTEKSAFTTLPLAVLVDGNTASGAEILAAALLDHKRASLVGERTAGRGDIRTVFPLNDGSFLVIRTALAYRSTGEGIEGKPVLPDREATVSTEERNKLYEGMESLSTIGNTAADVQLQAAVELLSH